MNGERVTGPTERHTEKKGNPSRPSGIRPGSVQTGSKNDITTSTKREKGQRLTSILYVDESPSFCSSSVVHGLEGEKVETLRKTRGTRMVT